MQKLSVTVNIDEYLNGIINVALFFVKLLISQLIIFQF